MNFCHASQPSPNSAVNAAKPPFSNPLPPDSSEPAEIVAVVVRGYN